MQFEQKQNFLKNKVKIPLIWLDFMTETQKKALTFAILRNHLPHIHHIRSQQQMREKLKTWNKCIVICSQLQSDQVYQYLINEQKIASLYLYQEKQKCGNILNKNFPKIKKIFDNTDKLILTMVKLYDV